ncbi:right-handed parallel beta-helix repeat-containing protein [Lactobacillus sp. ESL0677]|uniref:right-handed parallel beta-helix repeat-containing protein n=1 Tax=Lactobacillus sp. ESL0677 TaxID=2983208 RepID=UPI0023F6FFB1|nr:right-handed parallel beta-helix repeat-containing protein [Lactobacillus sp. ESL0677]WEV37314.1 right-handed parallel beta-helix repeat-containing protein [Lactobacillus sp. ESL0677]
MINIKTSYSRFIASILAVIMLVIFFNINSITAKAANYYVDSKTGSDTNSGLSVTSPWKSFKNINSKTFQPGDEILLKSGSVWNEQLMPQGNGNQTEPITISKYGGELKPRINGNGTHNYKRNSGTVMLVNQHDWIIKNLEVTNYSSTIQSQRSGILIINNSNTTQNNITVADNYVHDVNSDTQEHGAWKVTGGIILIGINEDLDGKINSNKNFGFDNVLVKNNHVDNVSIAGIRNKSTLLNTNGSESYPKNNKNITYENNDVENVYGDGMIISEVSDNGIVKNNKVNKFCNTESRFNYAGLWVMASDNTTVENNEVSNGLYGNNDGTAFDIDLSCNNVVVQHNYSHDNARGSVLFMNASHNGIFRYNVCINDGWNPNSKMISYLPSTTTEKAYVYNNLFIASPTTANLIKCSGNRRYLDFTNNLVISQNPNMVTFNQGTMTGELNFKNNAVYGFNSQWFGKDNISLKDEDTVKQLIADNAKVSGIANLNLKSLANLPELKKAGIFEGTGLTDFNDQPVANIPSIGPVELK